jgi:hypothetical protein
MATSKRPLAEVMGRSGSYVAPKRTVVVAGSGVAAVFVLGVLTFGLFRTQSDAKEHLAQVQRPATPFAASGSASASGGSASASSGAPAIRTEDSGNDAPSPENFTPAPPPDAPLPRDSMTDEPAPGSLPQNSLDPDGAGSEPPPPPPVEHPGPMEPPSSMHVGPPLGMQGVDPDAE